MAGGTWTTQNKVRPGAYVNTKNKNGATGTAETVAGVVTVPLPLDFGPEKKIVAIGASSDLTQFGYDLGNEKMVLLQEAFKAAETVLVYRVGSGVKAKIVEGDLTAEALYGGTRGNDINVVSKANVNVAGSFDVETYLGGRLVDSQTAAKIEDLQPNKVVEFAGTGDLTAFSIALAGGTNVAANVQDYMDYFEKVSVFDFNVMALPVTDEAIKAAGASFIKRLRDEEGKKCQVAIASFAGDHEAVINVKNSVILSDGTTVTKEQATAWVAGASAAAGVTTSLTYKEYPNAVDVTPRLLHSEIVDALKNGEFIFTERRGKVVVEQDINSLRSFTSDKGKDFSKNRVLRVLDNIANDAMQTFEDHFIGKINNDVDGREMFKANRIAYFDALQGAGAIINFEADDVQVLPGDEKEAVLLTVEVQPVDAMEKLYMTVQVV